MWKKEDPHALFMELQTGIATMENNMEFPQKLKNRGSTGQDGGIGIGRNTSLPRTTKRITTNLKTKNNQKCREIKPQGTLTTKEIKKHSSRPVGGAEMGSQAGGAGSPTFPCR